MESDRLLLIATGSSASMLLTAYLTELRLELQLQIDVLLTTSAERFVTAEAVGFLADRVFTADAPGLNPVALALGSAAIVVLPATANALAHAALGLMATPASTALGAAPDPVLYMPHMNQAIWRKPLVQQHVAALRQRGDVVVEPEEDDTFEIWRRSVHPGVSMPDPERAASIVKAWLTDRIRLARPSLVPSTPIAEEPPVRDARRRAASR